MKKLLVILGFLTAQTVSAADEINLVCPGTQTNLPIYIKAVYKANMLLLKPVQGQPEESGPVYVSFDTLMNYGNGRVIVPDFNNGVEYTPHQLYVYQWQVTMPNTTGSLISKVKLANVKNPLTGQIGQYALTSDPETGEEFVHVGDLYEDNGANLQEVPFLASSYPMMFINGMNVTCAYARKGKTSSGYQAYLPSLEFQGKLAPTINAATCKFSGDAIKTDGSMKYGVTNNTPITCKSQ